MDLCPVGIRTVTFRSGKNPGIAESFRGVNGIVVGQGEMDMPSVCRMVDLGGWL